MKTQFSREYYERNRRKYEGRREVINLEKELEMSVSFLNKSDYPEDVWFKLLQFYANQIIEITTKKLLEDKKVYMAVIKNHHCLGYTTLQQELRRAAEIIENYEYNCLVLSEFKQKYQAKPN